MNEHDLSRLTDDELIKRAVEAREAGDHDLVRKVLGVLVWRRYPDVVRRVSIKVHPNDVEDVAMQAVTSAITSAFEGTSVGEFVNYLHTIVARRIADYHRSRPKPTTPLPEEHEGDDDFWGDTLGGGDPAESTPETIDSSRAIRQALDELDDPRSEVVNLRVFADLSAEETADEVNMKFVDQLDPPMSASNVHQIATRFRKRVRKLLEEAEDSG